MRWPPVDVPEYLSRIASELRWEDKEGWNLNVDCWVADGCWLFWLGVRPLVNSINHISIKCKCRKCQLFVAPFTCTPAPAPAPAWSDQMPQITDMLNGIRLGSHPWIRAHFIWFVLIMTTDCVIILDVLDLRLFFGTSFGGVSALNAKPRKAGYRRNAYAL